MHYVCGREQGYAHLATQRDACCEDVGVHFAMTAMAHRMHHHVAVVDLDGGLHRCPVATLRADEPLERALRELTVPCLDVADEVQAVSEQRPHRVDGGEPAITCHDSVGGEPRLDQP